jgi:hypothetical protein
MKASSHFATRIGERSEKVKILSKAAALLMTVALMGEDIPPAEGTLLIVDKNTTETVAVHARKVVPIELLKIRADRDLDSLTEDAFVAKRVV